MKKKSHRKDVIIARGIFAVVCLVFIVIIAAAAVRIRDNYVKTHQDTQDSQTQDSAGESVNPALPPVTGEPVTESEEEFVKILWTSTNVNLRSEPNTSSEVITVLAQGARLEFLGEEEGWVRVSFFGQEGYVSTDYVTDEEPVQEADTP